MTWHDHVTDGYCSGCAEVEEPAGERIARLEKDEREAILDDLGDLLEVLGKPNVARPISPHEVMRECIRDVEAVTQAAEKLALELTRLRIHHAEVSSTDCAEYKDSGAALAEWDAMKEKP